MGMQPGHMRHMAVEADEVSQVIGICKGFKVSHNLQDRAGPVSAKPTKQACSGHLLLHVYTTLRPVSAEPADILVRSDFSKQVARDAALEAHTAGS